MSWLDSYNPARPITAQTNPGSVNSSSNSSASGSGLNIYGSGKDLANAMSKYGGQKGINFVDTSSKGFDASTMKNGIMLGGSGVNTNVSDSILNKAGIQRVWGQTGNDTVNALNNYMSSYGKPTLPSVPKSKDLVINATAPGQMEQIATPEFKQFEFNKSLQDYLDQAQGLLKPQLELATGNINDNYDTNYIPQANNDSLKRGLARSSFAGNRVDQLNVGRQKEITNATLQNQQQANNMGMQNYNVDYDRAYALNKDENQYNWQKYGADVQNAQNQYNNSWNQYRADVQDQKDIYNINNQNLWKNFDANMGLYNASNQDFWNNKNFNADQEYKNQQQQNWQKQYDTSNSQWQKQFDTSNSQWSQEFGLNKTNADREYQLKLKELAQAAARASSGGGSRSSGGSNKSSSGSLTKTQIKDRYSQTFDEAIASGDYEKVKAMVYGDKQNIINDMGYGYWQGLENKYSKWQSY